MSDIPPVTQYWENRCEFGGYIRDLTFQVPDFGSDISALMVSFWAAPDRNGTSVNDLRFSYNDRDITPLVLDFFKQSLSKLPPADLEDSYRSGVQALCAFAKPDR